MGFSLGILALCPRLSRRKGRLIATTAWRLRVLTLGALYRQVIVDVKERVVVVRGRYFWFFKRARRIRFDHIKAIGYGYSGVAASDWYDGWNWHGVWTRKPADNFTVQLKLHGGGDVHLFSFYGEGAFENVGPLPDWFYWEDYLFDLSGTQTQESRAYVELLSRMTGAPVEPLSW
jgi:hypothetical protein